MSLKERIETTKDGIHSVNVSGENSIDFELISLQNQLAIMEALACQAEIEEQLRTILQLLETK